MSNFDEFTEYFGPAATGTAATDFPGIESSPTLSEFQAEIGGGVFASGLISILSARENIDSLGGWENWVPKESRLFATSAMGMLFINCGEELWIVDTQYGEVIESNISIATLINSFAEESMREEYLYETRFNSWLEACGELGTDSVLAPTPALALGGTLEVSALREVNLQIYLSFTAQLFSGNGEMSVEIHRLG